MKQKRKLTLQDKKKLKQRFGPNWKDRVKAQELARELNSEVGHELPKSV